MAEEASVIAIDGPSAVGKSVVGKAVADRLGYLFLDTGLMYRAVTWLALRHGISTTADEARLAALAREAPISILPPTVADGRTGTLLVDERDVTWDVRSAEVDRHVSAVSMVPGVREALVERQREIAREGRVVMVGRDIGTVVLPQADLKVFLTATPEERAKRRYLELAARGASVDYPAILAAVKLRDDLDSHRAISPLRPAPDAVVVDTTHLTVEQVVERILNLAA